MSTGIEPSGAASPVPERRPHPAFSSPQLRQTLVTFAIAVGVVVPAWFWWSRRQADLDAKQQRQFETAVSQLQSSEALTKGELAALRTSGAKGVEDLRAEIMKMRSAWEASQQELEILRKQASERKSSLAVAQAKATGVKAAASRVNEQLNRLQAELATWHKSYESLLTNEAGRRIATSEKHLQLVAPALKRKRPLPSEVAGWQESLRILLKPLDDQSDGESELMVSPQHVAEIDTIGVKVAESLEQLHTDRALVDAVLSETVSVQPTNTTIDEALNQRSVAEIKAMHERLESARQTALDEQAAALATAQAELIKSQTAVKQQEIANERARLGAQLSALTDEQKAIKQREAEEIERQNLQREFDAALPDIKRYLVAFLADGFLERGAEAGSGPMSFAAIQRAGALSRDETGRQNLAHLVGNGGRSTGPLPRFRGGMTKPQQEACDRAQQLLTKFGPLMVEKGMLAK
jgi:hypothetical protein